MPLSGKVSFSLAACRTLLALCVVMAICSGCGYRFIGGADQRLGPDQSLWVSFIGNDTISPTAQTVIRRALLDVSHSQRGMKPAGSEAEAMIVVTGALRSYTTTAISYTAADRAREYRLLINVELEVHRKGTAAPLWKGMLQVFQDYPANVNLALQRNSEEAALAAASTVLAQRFLVTVEQSY